MTQPMTPMTGKRPAMTNKAPVSVCMISRNDPHLDKCLTSIENYVAEICVVITSDADKETEEICKKHNVKWITFTDCNENDKIIDFSLARNKSLELATNEWIMWLDSDDIVEGIEKLPELIKVNLGDADGGCFLFPYEYSYDANGICTCRHFRERLAKGKNNFEFKGAVHECLVPKSDKKCVLLNHDQIIIKHQRQYNPKIVETGRNLRILQKYFENGGTDPRNMYYIGLEYSNHRDFSNSIKYLTQYISVSGWDDEKAMALIKLVEIYQGFGNYNECLKYSFELLKLKHNWFESYYCLCKSYYFLNDFSKAVHYAKIALNCEPTNTLLFVDLSARHTIHTFLNVALNNIGKTQEAYESCLAGLKGLPNDVNLKNNKVIYEKHLQINVPMTEIKSEGGLGVVFVTASNEKWNPTTVKEKGIGGSETMLMNLATELAAIGHNVHVYAADDGVFDKVQYHTYTDFHHIDCDVLVVSRYAQFLAEDSVRAKLKLLWLHDVCAHGATAELMLKADKVLALSEWHRQNIIAVHHLPEDQVIKTRNGIDLMRFLTVNPPEKDKYKCINSSSPDRSWPVLLAMWPRIKEAVPEATLELCYGFANWKLSAANDPAQMSLIANLEKQIEDLRPLGVIFNDRINQEELAKLFKKSTAWLYPTWFTETSCISAMEAQAAYCTIITSPIAALKETCANYDKTIFVEGNWTDKEYQDKFIEETIKVLNK